MFTRLRHGLRVAVGSQSFLLLELVIKDYCGERWFAADEDTGEIAEVPFDYGTYTVLG